MEQSRINIQIGDVSFVMDQICVGADPQTGLIRVVTKFELTPAPHASRWIAYFTAEGPEEDRAHAFAAAAGVALFYGMSADDITKRLGPAYMLSVNRFVSWLGPVSETQFAGVIQSALQLFSSTETRGVRMAFNEIGGMLGIPAQCNVDVIGRY